MPQYLVERLDYPAVREKNVASEPYAFLHSREFEKIFGVKKREASREGAINGYLTICSCDTGSKIRLQYKSWGVASGKVRLSDGNLYALGIYGKESPEVRISRCSPLIYHYHKADTLTKVAFWMGAAGLLMSFI